MAAQQRLHGALRTEHDLGRELSRPCIIVAVVTSKDHDGNDEMGKDGRWRARGMSSKRKRRRANKRSAKMQVAVEVVREQLEPRGEGTALELASRAQQEGTPAQAEEGALVQREPSLAPAPDSSATALAFGDVTPARTLIIPEDEHSVPPASDLDIDGFEADADPFFSGPLSEPVSAPVFGPRSWPVPNILAVEDDPFLWVDARDPRTRSLAPQAVARRALFARYVRGAVGVSLALCLAAVVKTVLTRDDEPPRHYAATAVWPPPEDAPPPLATDLPPAIGAVQAVPGADAATPAIPAASKPADDSAAAGPLRVR
jgi:hypothetical protein